MTEQDAEQHIESGTWLINEANELLKKHYACTRTSSIVTTN